MLRLEHHGTWASITPESLMPQHLGRDVARFPRQAGALYDRRGFKHRVGFGPRPAVVVVDLMRGFTDPACPLGSALDGVVRATCRILAVARQQGVPVLFTTIDYAEDLADAGLWPGKVPALTSLRQGSPRTEFDLASNGVRRSR